MCITQYYLTLFIYNYPIVIHIANGLKISESINLLMHGAAPRGVVVTN